MPPENLGQTDLAGPASAQPQTVAPTVGPVPAPFSLQKRQLFPVNFGTRALEGKWSNGSKFVSTKKQPQNRTGPLHARGLLPGPPPKRGPIFASLPSLQSLPGLTGGLPEPVPRPGARIPSLQGLLKASHQASLTPMYMWDR